MRVRWVRAVAGTMLAAALLALASCGHDGQTSSGPSDTEGTTQSTGSATDSSAAIAGACIDFDNFGRAALIADHQPTADEAVESWIDTEYELGDRGPVTFTAVSTTGSRVSYSIEQSGEDAGEVEAHQDEDGWWIARGSMCSEWPESATAGSTVPIPESVTDQQTGVSYSVPPGWKPEDDLLDYFTSGMVFGPDSAGEDSPWALFAVGTIDSSFFVEVSPENLATATTPFAKSFSEFFFAASGRDDVVVDEATLVDGHEGHHVLLHFVPDDGSDEGWVDVVTVKDGDGAIFLLAAANGTDLLDTDVQAVVSSIQFDS